MSTGWLLAHTLQTEGNSAGSWVFETFPLEPGVGGSLEHSDEGPGWGLTPSLKDALTYEEEGQELTVNSFYFS